MRGRLVCRWLRSSGVGKEIPLIRESVDDVITVSTDGICAAVKDIFEIHALSLSLPVRWRWRG